MNTINGSTKNFVILGQPIEHTLSPAMYNAAFGALQYNGVYLACLVPEDKLAEAVQGIRALGIRGGNVTIPFKEKIIPYLDGITEEARLIGAVNTLYWEEERLMGANTDGLGFLKALQGTEPAAFDFSGAVILGAGGAAKAVGVSLALSGIPKIYVVNRDLAKAEGLARILRSIGSRVQILNWSNPELKGIISQTPLVINTTPLGMDPKIDVCPAIPYEALSVDHLAVDLIYKPAETLFLQKAKNQGCRIMNGLGMLLEQGVLSMDLWAGLEAPRAVMAQELERW